MLLAQTKTWKPLDCGLFLEKVKLKLYENGQVISLKNSLRELNLAMSLYI